MKPYKTFEEAKEDLSDLEDWEQEFHARFGGSKFYPYIDPSRVRKFIRDLLEKKSEKRSK